MLFLSPEDGTSARTGASCYGKLICACRKNRIFKCNCPRKFSDPDASWGWNSYFFAILVENANPSIKYRLRKNGKIAATGSIIRFIL